MSYHSEKGFTLLELVAVFGIIAILSSAAFYSISSRSSELITEADSLRSYIRYTQARALAYGNTYILQCSGNSYAMYHESVSTKNIVTLPNGDTRVRMADDIRFASRSRSFALAFDNWGVPGLMVNSTVTPLSRRFIITLRKEKQTQTITIVPATGFVE